MVTPGQRDASSSFANLNWKKAFMDLAALNLAAQRVG
jgi:hypothetical protein